jgi:lysozyme
MAAADMKASGACRALIREFEGCRLRAYQDSAGIWTIGVGHTRGVKQGDQCSQQQADVWLTEDLHDAEAAVSSSVKKPLTQNQFDALVSFTFNLGGRRLAESTLLILLNRGNYAGAAAQFPCWNKSNGVTLPGLVRRRAAEAALFCGDARVPA